MLNCDTMNDITAGGCVQRCNRMNHESLDDAAVNKKKDVTEGG